MHTNIVSTEEENSELNMTLKVHTQAHHIVYLLTDSLPKISATGSSNSLTDPCCWLASSEYSENSEIDDGGSTKFERIELVSALDSLFATG